MLTHPTLEKLQALRLTGMLKGLEEQLQMSGLEELGFAERLRSFRRGAHTTQDEHMPQAHRAYAEWTPERLVRWAQQAGPSVASLIATVMATRVHPQQGFRSCLGIMRLSQRYGGERLDAACQRALQVGAASYRSVRSILLVGLQVARHALALREALHGLGAHPDVELLAHQLVRHAVVVAVDLDVVVDVDPPLRPLRVREAFPGQRSQRRPLEALEQRPARPWQLAEGPVVQRAEKLPDRLVELGEREKLPVPQPGQDPSLHELHARLDLGLVAGLTHPRRHHRHAVVHRQVLVGRIELRLVATGAGDAAAQIVRDHQLGEAAAEFEGPYVRTDPVGKTLAPRRLREGVAARTPHRHEDLRLPHFPGPGVHHRHRRAAVVHEQLLARPVHLAHAQVQLPSPGPVQLAETAVLVTVWLPLPVLLPDQAQRHVLELQLFMHLHPVHRRSLAPRRPPRRRIEPSLELLATPPLPPRFQHASPLRSLQVLRDARPPDTAHPTGLPLAQTAHQKQPQHLLNFPHAESPCRHLPPFVVKDEDATASEPNSSLVPTGRRPPFRSMPATLPTTTHKWPPSRRKGWPPSPRKGGRLHVGIPGRLRPEYAVISPLLANVYLHEVLDTWFEREVQPRLKGRACLVRYADDFVLVFAKEQDASRVAEVVAKRLARFGLRLHPDKTRLINFRRPSQYVTPTRQQRPGTFDLLGFTHYWGRARTGDWALKRKTSKNRLKRSLQRANEWCRSHRHYPLPWQHQQLARKLRGYDNYYGLTGNFEALEQFRRRLQRIWREWLNRRSQRKGVTWKRFREYLKRNPLPRPVITQPAIP